MEGQRHSRCDEPEERTGQSSNAEGIPLRIQIEGFKGSASTGRNSPNYVGVAFRVSLDEGSYCIGSLPVGFGRLLFTILGGFGPVA